MQARLIAYVPEAAAIARIVARGERLRVGRADDADLVIAHPSVSRRHAEFEPQRGGGWRLLDLDSKNGTFIDGARISHETLARACWLRFGDVHCELMLLDAGAAADQVRRWQARRTHATLLTARIDALGTSESPDATSQALLEHSLRAVLELSQCSRGFVLIAADGRYRVATSLALDSAFRAGDEFTGSLGAVGEALRTRQPVVLNDIGQDAWLSRRDSVVDGGLRTLVALPLLGVDGAIGAIYADRREAGPPLTTLDVELLQAFAERCALWVVARDEAGRQPEPAPPGPGDWDALLRGDGATR